MLVFWGPRIHLPALLGVSGVSEEIEILLWALVVALAWCLYAPELDIQSSEAIFAQCVLTAVEEHDSSADPQCPVKGHLS